MKRIYFVLSLFVLCDWAVAGTPVDSIYDDKTKTVTLLFDGLPLTAPVMNLGNSVPLLLSFDRFIDDIENLEFRITHCNKDWRPSDIHVSEYLDGFDTETIDEYESSFNTYQDYVHYKVFIPDEDQELLISGNYKVTVFADNDPDNILFTVGFMVLDPIFSIGGQVQRSFDPAKGRTHQELDFAVNLNNTIVQVPTVEVSATVLQNWQWKTAYKDVKPIFNRGDVLDFDYQDKIVFPGGKEYRFVDLRSTRFQSNRVNVLTEVEDKVEMYLFEDLQTTHKSYVFWKDVNGRFLIENTDDNDNEAEVEYVETHFFYRALDIDSLPVYVVSDFNNYSHTAPYKMEFIPERKMYHCMLYLKQGYYNYRYEKSTSSRMETIMRTEGSSYETENEYQVLIYYRPFGDRFDRLVGYTQFRSIP